MYVNAGLSFISLEAFFRKHAHATARVFHDIFGHFWLNLQRKGNQIEQNCMCDRGFWGSSGAWAWRGMTLWNASPLLAIIQSFFPLTTMMGKCIMIFADFLALDWKKKNSISPDWTLSFQIISVLHMLKAKKGLLFCMYVYPSHTKLKPYL